MAEGHALGLDEIDQQVGLIAARINLLHAGGGRGKGQPPAMDVEHRGDRHVNVFAVEAALPGREAEADQVDQRVQDELTVAEIDSLRKAGRAGRVEHRGSRVLVEILELEIGRRLRQQLLVVTDDLVGLRGEGAVVGYQDDAFDGFQLVAQLLDERQKIDVHQQ